MIIYIGEKYIKKIRKIIIMSIVIIGFYLFFLIFPLILVGPPTPLFIIHNKDSVSHDIIVEIFNDHQDSVFKEKYLMNNNEIIEFERKIQWWPYPPSFITWSNGKHTFNITVDYKYSKEITRDITQYETIDVEVFAMDYPKVLIPIRISIVTV